MKVLIIGLGSIAHKHINAVVKLHPDADLYALRRKNSISSHPSVINIFSLNEVSDFSFAIVCNPTSQHAATIELLSQNKIPMFIEKPLFDNLSKKHLVDQVAANGIITYVACNLRFLDCIQFIKNELFLKRVNEVNIYCGSYLPDWRPGVDFRTIYSANKEMGGGVHIDLIHEIDYMFWIFSKPSSARRYFSSVSSLEISSYDYANYLFEYPGFNVNVQLNYYRRDAKRSLEILCDDGTFYVDLLKNSVAWNDKIVFESHNSISDTYNLQMEYFINRVLTKKEQFNDIEEAYEILTLCLKD